MTANLSVDILAGVYIEIKSEKINIKATNQFNFKSFNLILTNNSTFLMLQLLNWNPQYNIIQLPPKRSALGTSNHDIQQDGRAGHW